jgi:hypothetical protein
VRRALLLFVAALATGCGTSGSASNADAGASRPCNDIEGPVAPLSDEALGDPCAATTDCASGLTCEQPFFLGGAVWTSMCTMGCGSGAPSCPQGAVCLQAEANVVVDGGSARPMLCTPSCTSDADCRTHTRAGTCKTGDGGVHYCTPLSCFAGQCQSGYACVGAVCAPPGAGIPDEAGWCRKQ